MKTKCIVDTCSCIYLNKSTFKQKSLLKLFSDRVDISYSNEIFLELKDHEDKGIPKFIINERLKLRTIKYSINEYEKRMIGKTLPSRKKGGNKGEINNFLLCVDLIHHFRRSPIIYLTDDEKAINGFISEWFKAFPSISLWTSYDVVLFLYAEGAIPSSDMAVELLKDLIAITAPLASERNNELTKKLTKRLVEYRGGIEKINKLLF